MKQEISGKAEKVKVDMKQKGEVVFKWLLTVIYFILLIYFVLKPLTEFMLMVEYNIKIGILKYFIK